MLKKILSVSGKPGLFKLISRGKSLFVVESLLDGKRVPVYLRDKVVSLHDIAIYTADEDVPLSQVLTKIKEKEAGKTIDYKSDIKPEELKAYLATVLPDFDKDRVYPSDIKKLLAWYNLLINAGFTDFSDEPDEDSAEELAETADAITDKAATKPKATASAKKGTTAKAGVKATAKTAAPKSAPKATTKSAAKASVRGVKGAKKG
jgi:hypothetical protein